MDPTSPQPSNNPTPTPPTPPPPPASPAPVVPATPPTPSGPTQPQPAPTTPPVNQTAQTGNAGVPLQVENVQYKNPVESKIGLYTRIANIGLWLTVIFVCTFIASLLGGESDLGALTVFTISLSVVSVPIFIIANGKREKELASNPALVDDMFFKKSVRRNLSFAVTLTALSLFWSVFMLLSKLFLSNSGYNYSGPDIIRSIVYTLGFAGILAFYWRLHAKTKR